MGGLTAIDGMVENALDAFRQLDILHNNTSGAVPGAASDIDPEEWDRSLRLGLRPFWYAIRWALPHMIGGGGGSRWRHWHGYRGATHRKRRARCLG
ncbi:MAG: SDR family oxidoreductase [Caulobacteraceae bacterium]|nr:SDR family oxidoreductase [Caulobacteraceae bacterium]